MLNNYTKNFWTFSGNCQTFSIFWIKIFNDYLKDAFKITVSENSEYTGDVALMIHSMIHLGYLCIITYIKNIYNYYICNLYTYCK